MTVISDRSGLTVLNLLMLRSVICLQLIERRSQDNVETSLLEKQLHEAEASIHNFINGKRVFLF